MAEPQHPRFGRCPASSTAVGSCINTRRHAGGRQDGRTRQAERRRGSLGDGREGRPEQGRGRPPPSSPLQQLSATCGVGCTQRARGHGTATTSGCCSDGYQRWKGGDRRRWRELGLMRSCRRCRLSSVLCTRAAVLRCQALCGIHRLVRSWTTLRSELCGAETLTSTERGSGCTAHLAVWSGRASHNPDMINSICAILRRLGEICEELHRTTQNCAEQLHAYDISHDVSVTAQICWGEDARAQ